MEETQADAGGRALRERGGAALPGTDHFSQARLGALSDIVAEVLPATRRMVVDLAGVDSVDSGGLGDLVLTHMWAEAAGYR